MAKNVVILNPGESVIYEDFADLILIPSTPAHILLPKSYRKLGRLYLTNQRLIHAVWRHEQIVISRRFDLAFLSRFATPRITIDLPLTAIGAFAISMPIFTKAEQVTIEPGSGVTLTTVLEWEPQKKTPVQYQAVIRWSQWSREIEKALTAQGLRLREDTSRVKRLQRDPANLSPTTISQVHFDEIADAFDSLFTTRWIVEKMKT